jgi:putative SOS response-associated peptidase YedK
LCNLYSVTKGQQAIREFTGAMRDRTGNLPPLYGIFPDYSAPIVRNEPKGRELMMARWGMPSPVFVLRGKKSDPGVTNVRKVASPHWRRWLGIENRCVVPWTSFSENEVLPDGSRPAVWFALDETRPLACENASNHDPTAKVIQSIDFVRKNEILPGSFFARNVTRSG